MNNHKLSNTTSSTEVFSITFLISAHGILIRAHIAHAQRVTFAWVKNWSGRDDKQGIILKRHKVAVPVTLSPSQFLIVLSKMSAHHFKVLKEHIERLESSLEQTNLVKVSMKLLESKIISKDVKDKFVSLDQDYLDQDRKVRYLLQQVCERVREDDQVYDRLVRVLTRLGGGVKDVCEGMRKELDRIDGGKASDGAEGGVCLTDRDISGLVELLVTDRHKWEEISVALALPECVRFECRNLGSNPLKVTMVLREWISGSYKNAKSATLENLREALSSEIVGLHNISLRLLTFDKSVDPLPEAKTTHSSINPQIHLQSCDTEVAEGKSTLLEVQVSSSGYESYQWSKDGQPLLDGADFSGVSSNILYIDRASQGTEGKYSCCVSNGSETVCSDEINLMVIYPPEKERLIKLYSLIESEVPKDSWPPVGISTFINLVLIKQSPISRCYYYTVRGDMDDILESKERVEYEEVFREYREGELVLVEGRPGSGKTTLVHKVSRDWATGRKVLQGAKMVFLITLRLLNFSGRDRSLLDMLEEFYDGEVMRKKIEHDLQECGGKGACFIIDGLDEYQHKNKKESVIYQLIYKQCLRLSMVIVASRPVATDEVKKCSAKRIEVVGFTKSQIHDYVETYPFNGSDNVLSYMVSKLKVYLSQHPNVLHMCYLPVHAAMIGFLFSQLEGNIPHTETQIYEQFTIATLLRQKTRTEEPQQLKSLKDLYGKEKEDFKLICKLAYHMIINSQQVVSQSNTPVPFSDFTSSVLGLLTVERTFRHYGLEHLYTFPHLTFQEYLAAFHIAGLEEQEQINAIANYSGDTNLKNVWKFYCGLLGLEKSVLLKNIKFLLRKLGELDIFSLIRGLPEDDILSPNIVQCAFESQQLELCDYVVGDGSLKLKSFITPSDFSALGYVISTASQHVSVLDLKACTWDYDGVMALSSVDTSNKLHSIKCLKVFGIASDDMCKALNCLLLQLPLLEELDFGSSRQGKFYIVECLTSNITLSNLTYLKITLPLAPCSHPEKVLQSLTFGSHNIKQVYVYVDDKSYKSSNYAMWRKCLCYAFGFHVVLDSHISWVHLYNSESFSSSLPQERFSYFSEVVLVNCGIDDEGAEILVIRLNTTVLEKLVLDFNRISDSGAVALAGCIARCSVVQEVSIQCNSIGDLGTIALADALVHCSSLRRLDLQGNGLGDEGAVAIAKAAEGLPNLDLYLHNVNITEEGVERVLEHRASTKIRAMVFGSSWDAISDAGIDALRSALKCGTLPALKISRTNIYNIKILVAELEHVRNIRGLECDDVTDDSISSTSAQLLGDILRTCKFLYSVSLHGDVYGIKYGHSVSIDSILLEAVKCCTNLRSLNMTHCIIGSDGVTSLFCDYKSWVNLHTLNLSTNDIGSDGAQVLSKVLVHCKNLRYLDLSHNGFGDTEYLSLADGLQNHTRLLELKLGRNDITADMAAMIPVVKRNHLQHLDLSFCDIGSDDIAALVDVTCADTLQTLNLSITDLDLDGAIILGVGLQRCRQLKELDISDNSIGPCGLACLAEGLKCCRQLVKLNISSNDIGSYGLSFLADGLQHCIHLQVLKLKRNEITSDGIAALTVIMKRCRYLQKLSLKGNSIGVDGAAVLVGGWQHKSMLTLDLLKSLGDPHESALVSVERCCSSCDHLLELYYNNDYVIIRIGEGNDMWLPKLVSSS